MPGIYIHIPFCRQACHYCNFHFSTSLRYKEEMLQAILQELSLRSGYLEEKELDSIYFGGGTPSLLTESELMRFFDAIGRYFRLRPGAEITLEANPDDLTPEKVQALRHTPVNRLSIGIQSFHDEDLRFFNRAHTAGQARASLEHALSAGFTGLTIDLIYGAPTTGQKQWEENIDIFFGYGIPHLSSYALTVEDRTALAHFIKTGKVPPVEDEKAARQYEYLMASMHAGGYVQYEISNFARPGCFAVHNSSYWKGEPYLGLGPSAHSYNGASRQWNISNNAGYIRLLQGSSGAQALIPGLFETEHLSTATRYNEYVMTGLRTIWGVELFHLRQMAPAYENYFLENIRPFLDAGQAKQEGDTISLTDAGRLLADGIASAVFMVGETGPEFRM